MGVSCRHDPWEKNIIGNRQKYLYKNRIVQVTYIYIYKQ